MTQFKVAALMGALGVVAAAAGVFGAANNASKSLEFNDAWAAFVSKSAMQMPAPADRLRSEIVDTCALAANETLREATANALIGQAFGLVKIRANLSLGDVNTLLGSPVQVGQAEYAPRCLCALAAFYFAYPDLWEFTKTSLGNRDSFTAFETLFDSHPDT
ncbi:MAG: hypothetical protein GY883_23510 [Shimia sp.]|nr:hypothetical protein [Shimia sp.]